MRYEAGWWRLDRSLPGLVNRVTEERVILRGEPGADDVGAPGQWLRFDYEHPELRFPVLVEARPRDKTLGPAYVQALIDVARPEMRPDLVNFFWNVSPSRSMDFELRLDYGRSARLWRAETGASAPHPPYGTWRRVDDCMTDALACWPRTGTAPEPLSGRVEICGGWLNGSWNESVERRIRRLTDKDRARLPERSEVTTDTWLMPLDAPAPSPFELRDVIAEAGGGPAVVADKLMPDGLEFRSEPRPRHMWLPRSKGITGLEGRVACMVSRDGRRVLYPYRGDPPGPNYNSYVPAELHFLYADDDIVCEVSGAPQWPASGVEATWKFSTWPSLLGRRNEDVDPALGMATTGPESRRPAPSRALWLRLFWAVADAWTQWPGSRAVGPPTWFECLRLVATKELEIEDAYRGGWWAIRANCRILPPKQA